MSDSDSVSSERSRSDTDNSDNSGKVRRHDHDEGDSGSDSRSDSDSDSEKEKSKKKSSKEVSRKKESKDRRKDVQEKKTGKKVDLKEKKKDQKEKDKKSEQSTKKGKSTKKEKELPPHPLLGWTNPPIKSDIHEIGSKIIVKVPPRTDYWRKTRDNFIMDNAPFYWHKVRGDFEVAVKIIVQFNNSYDKAGIMIRDHEENWITSGMEYYLDQLNHSTCVTRDFTDWSLTPLPIDRANEKHGCWFGIMRAGNTYTSFYSVDGERWVTTRQGLFDAPEAVRVGIFCACPENKTFKVTFEDYRERQF